MSGQARQTRRRGDVGSPAREFRASWLTSMGFVVLLLFGIEVALVVGAWHAPAIHRTGWWGAVLLFGALVARLAAPFASRQAVLRIGPQGVTGWILRGHVVPWREIEDVTLVEVRNQRALVLKLGAGAPSLAPTRRWTNSFAGERHIPMAHLPEVDHDRLAYAVRSAFATYAAANADAAVQRHAEERQAHDAFAQRLRELTPRTWALHLLVALNVLVWLLTVLSGVEPSRASAADMFRWGANSAWAVTRDGEVWRMLTAAFLHSGFPHLAFNMLGLWLAGRLLNRLHGNVQFLVIYFASALVGSAVSLHFSSQTAVAVGASGAVFGVFGALLMAVWEHRERIPVLLSRGVVASEGVFIFAALLQGFTRAGVDNSAHVGGLLAGVATAWILVEKIEDAPAAVRARQRAIALLGTLAVVAGLVLATPTPPVDHRRGFQVQAVFQDVSGRLPYVQGALQRDAGEHRAGRLGEAEFVAALEGRHLPAFRALDREIAPLTLAPADPRRPLLEDLQRLTASSVALLDWQVRRSRGSVDAQVADPAIAALSAEISQLSGRLEKRQREMASRRRR